jgi:hypothetical protein
LSTGTIIVHALPTPTNSVVLYARVSSSDQTVDLDRQLQRLRDFRNPGPARVAGSLGDWFRAQRTLQGADEDVGGLSSASILVVEHRDCLAKFGSEYIESALVFILLAPLVRFFPQSSQGSYGAYASEQVTAGTAGVVSGSGPSSAVVHSFAPAPSKDGSGWGAAKSTPLIARGERGNRVDSILNDTSGWAST